MLMGRSRTHVGAESYVYVGADSYVYVTTNIRHWFEVAITPCYFKGGRKALYNNNSHRVTTLETLYNTNS